MKNKNYKAVIEAILFTMGDSVEITKIANTLELDIKKTKKILMRQLILTTPLNG